MTIDTERALIYLQYILSLYIYTYIYIYRIHMENIATVFCAVSCKAPNEPCNGAFTTDTHPHQIHSH